MRRAIAPAYIARFALRDWNSRLRSYFENRMRAIARAVHLAKDLSRYMGDIIAAEGNQSSTRMTLRSEEGFRNIGGTIV